MDDDDRLLWDRARAGDAAAFGDLYTRQARQVYTFCFWRTGDAALAEDLSAAVFLEVWAARGRTELTEASLLPWLLGVAHNLVRNQWRSNRRRRAALARLPPLRDSPDRRTHPGALHSVVIQPDRIPPGTVLVIGTIEANLDGERRIVVYPELFTDPAPTCYETDLNADKLLRIEQQLRPS
ncbi:sigma factor [Dactylosporangium sp. NPDC050588]|uniref:RNA polymerase sigma factor n=1 Tax=Dactylosporangium sp. NPDC050588 TaxID=3157211 RepID=UPI0033FAD06A